MQTMKGLAVDKQGKLSIAELDIPEINEYQALVKTVACGICNGTDAKLIHNNFKLFDSYPAILGHEGVGEVVKIGAKVTTFKVGDRVLLPFLMTENRGYYPGWGGFAEYGVVGDAAAMEADKISPIPEGHYAQSVIPTDMDPVRAVMVVTFREVLSAIRRFDLRAGQPILVYGAGPVGLCFISFCKLLGLSPIIAVEIDDAKLAEAKRLGADVTLNGAEVDVAAEVKKIFPDGIENIVDAAGVNALINQAMQMVKYNGKICVYGISARTSMELDWSLAPYNWSLNFVQWPSKIEEGEAHEQVLAWLASGEICFDDYISDILPFAEIIPAYESLLSGISKKKTIICFP